MSTSIGTTIIITMRICITATPTTPPPRGATLHLSKPGEA